MLIYEASYRNETRRRADCFAKREAPKKALKYLYIASNIIRGQQAMKILVTAASSRYNLRRDCRSPMGILLLEGKRSYLKILRRREATGRLFNVDWRERCV